MGHSQKNRLHYWWQTDDNDVNVLMMRIIMMSYITDDRQYGEPYPDNDNNDVLMIQWCDNDVLHYWWPAYPDNDNNDVLMIQWCDNDVLHYWWPAYPDNDNNDALMIQWCPNDNDVLHCWWPPAVPASPVSVSYTHLTLPTKA